MEDGNQKRNRGKGDRELQFSHVVFQLSPRAAVGNMGHIG